MYASKEYRSAFFKSLLGRELNGAETRAMNRAMEIEKRADNYTTSGNTAVVLPTSTLNEVIAKARKEGGLLARCRAFAMPSNISIPVGTPSSKAIWNTEGKDATADAPQIVEVAFNGYEIIKLFSISAKVKTMSIDAFEAYLVDELNNCVLECLADGIVMVREQIKVLDLKQLLGQLEQTLLKQMHLHMLISQVQWQCLNVDTTRKQFGQ